MVCSYDRIHPLLFAVDFMLVIMQLILGQDIYYLVKDYPCGYVVYDRRGHLLFLLGIMFVE